MLILMAVGWIVAGMALEGDHLIQQPGLVQQITGSLLILAAAAVAVRLVFVLWDSE